MRLLAKLTATLSTLFRGNRLDRDLDEELRASLDLLVERKIRAGLPASDAHRSARLELEGLDQIKEQVRDARVGHRIETALQDARLGWRSIRRAPGFSAVVIATLALGIGANTAIFSVVHALLVEPPPYRDPGRLMFIWSNLDRAGYPRAPLSGPELRDLRERSRSFESIGAPTYLAVAAVLPCAALLASWLPARRAARVSPIEALKID